VEYNEGGSTSLKIEKKKARASRSLSPKSHGSKDISEDISDDLAAWHFSDSDSVDQTEVTFVEGKGVFNENGS
jgi:BRCT domain type II-containing protein